MTTSQTIALSHQICIFTRNYIGDLELAPYLYRSMEQHAPDISEIVLVVEEQDISAFRAITPGCADSIFVRRPEIEDLFPGKKP